MNAITTATSSSRPERRDEESRAALRLQVRAVLATSAGLTITAAQIARLCGLRSDIGQRIAEELTATGVLSRLDAAQRPGGDRWRQKDAFALQTHPSR